MRKVEKVRINLPKSTKAPVKVCQIRNQKPVPDEFQLIPKYMPSLTQLISDVKWDCAEKTFNIRISETASFDAYNWFGYINKRSSEAHKSSFVDLEQDSLLLIFQDKDQKDVMSIRFRGLQLIHHACYLSKKSCQYVGSSTSAPISHSITIKYAESEMFPCHLDDESYVSPTCEQNEVVDEEWQAVAAE